MVFRGNRFSGWRLAFSHDVGSEAEWKVLPFEPRRMPGRPNHSTEEHALTPARYCV